MSRTHGTDYSLLILYATLLHLCAFIKQMYSFAHSAKPTAELKHTIFKMQQLWFRNMLKLFGLTFYNNFPYDLLTIKQIIGTGVKFVDSL